MRIGPAMALYEESAHDVKNPRINAVAANCVARIARLGFDRADHLHPLERIIGLSCTSSHKVAREGCCHEYCERYDANPPRPGCIGVATHVELPEDRVGKKAFQTLGLLVLNHGPADRHYQRHRRMDEA